MPTLPSLVDRMRELADKDHPRATELRVQAGKLEVAIAAAMREEGTPDDTLRMLGTWARSRRLWCEITGEVLV